MNRPRLCVLTLLAAGPVLRAGEPPSELQADWAWQHRFMVVQDAKTGAANLRFADSREQPAPLVDPQAGILKEDRDPTDVVARRVDALLRHLGRLHPSLPCWIGFRQRLDPLLTAAKTGRPDLAGAQVERQKTFQALCALRREISFANPLLDFEDVVFSEESNVGNVLSRATTGQYNGLQTSDPGMGLYVIRGWKGASPRVVALCQEAKVENGPYQGQILAGGMFHAPSLTYDGKTILFSWAKLHYSAEQKERRTADPLRIFRIDVDGTGLRQITTDAGGHNDTEPCEMPDLPDRQAGGRIVFMSTRREVYDRCVAYRPAFTLCSMKPDGTDILLLSRHETHEWLPSIGNDGMILYTRWDYVDRKTCAPHGLWICFPDGRDSRAPNGNYYGAVFTRNSPAYSKLNPSHRSRQPMTTAHFHAIPGSRKLMAIGSSHHPVEIGPVILIDLDKPDDYAGGQITALTPGRWGGDWGGEFTAPWPLSEDFFLVGCLDRLYLMDRFGNRELIHVGARMHELNRARAASWGRKELLPDDPADMAVDYLPTNWRPTFPQPVRARPRPPVIFPQTFQSEDHRGRPGHQPATIAIQNVYDSDIPLPQGVKIKALRLVQVLGCSTGDYNKSGGVKGGENSAVKIVLGTVPVEADGSVHCLAPIDKGFYFQALDEQGLAVQSMKSLTYVHAGERLSCRGCHEPYNKAGKPLPQVPQALRRAPSPVTPETPDGRLRMIDDYVMPAVDRVFSSLDAHLEAGGPPLGEIRDLGDAGKAGGRRQVGHPAIRLIQPQYKGAWFNQVGIPVNNGENDHRTAPDAFGARGSGIWRYLQTHRDRLQGLERDDLRLFALWLDLLCVSSSHWGDRFTVKDAAGTTWPRHPDLDVNNPLGLEVAPAGDNR
jgi:hypothetical protein